MDMELDGQGAGDDGGWGRPRPRFEDLLPSEPEDVGQEDLGVMSDVHMTDDSDEVAVDAGAGPLSIVHPAASSARVVPLIDLPLPGCDGVPKAELDQTYRKKCPQCPRWREYFKVQDNGKKSPKIRFVCFFKCPVSGERFASGHWGEDVTVEGATNWHRTIKDAVNAAAARALDCFSLRRCHGTEKRPYQRCKDAPYLSAENAPTLPSMYSSAVFPPTISQKECADVAPPLSMKASLCSFYRKWHASGPIAAPVKEILPGKDSYSSWSNWLTSPHIRFTAVFTCPRSGERFASGKLVGVEGSYEEDYWLYNCNGAMLFPRDKKTAEEDCARAGESSDGCSGLLRVNLVWYRTKKEAESAAAARALDCLIHRQSSDSSVSSVRYCKEAAYAYGNTPDVWKNASQSVEGVRDCVYNKKGVVSFVEVKWPQRREGVDVHDVGDLSSFAHDQDHWRASYKERRGMDQRIAEEEPQ